MKNYRQMGTEPSLKEAEFWGNMCFFEYESQYIARPRKWIYYMMNPKGLIRDLSSSFWKIGFLKRLFAIKLPYNKIYGLLKKKYSS